MVSLPGVFSCSRTLWLDSMQHSPVLHHGEVSPKQSLSNILFTYKGLVAQILMAALQPVCARHDVPEHQSVLATLKVDAGSLKQLHDHC